ncbi:MAG: hypothetical protein ABSC14_08760, partial [Desulfomonilia bacterium]
MNTWHIRFRFHSYGIPILTISFFLFLGLCICEAQADEPAVKGFTRQELVFLPAHQLAEMIRTGKITSREVVEAYLEQISRVNPKLNAVVGNP